MNTRIFAVALTGAITAGAYAGGTWNIAGEFQGWTAEDAAWAMADSGGNDIFTHTTTSLLANNDAEYKAVTGPWTESYPGSGNSWAYVPSDNASVTFTFDTNTYADGWFPESNRIYTDTLSLLTTWHAVGDWQGWDPGNAATLMSDIGGGVYSLDFAVPTAGTHEFKVTDGTWGRQIGADGVGVNSATLFFDTTTDGEVMTFQVDTGNGTIRVIPTPGTLALMGIGGVAAIRRRR